MHTTMPMHFTKMEGLGNDFIVLEAQSQNQSQDHALSETHARKLCDRRFGIGADQILNLKPDPHADCFMEIWNSDGSKAEMCGNGIRAVALFLREKSPSKSAFQIQTAAGLMSVSFETVAGEALPWVRVNMGSPKLADPFGETLNLGEAIVFYEVNMGNPHAVIHSSKVEQIPLETLGPQIENHLRFPKRTNVEFFEVQPGGVLKTRVWERGAGITLACGTGACATAVSALKLGLVQNPVWVELPGGRLKIEWAGGPSDPVWMTGPARFVFKGEVQI